MEDMEGGTEIIVVIKPFEFGNQCFVDQIARIDVAEQ